MKTPDLKDRFVHGTPAYYKCTDITYEREEQMTYTKNIDLSYGDEEHQLIPIASERKLLAAILGRAFNDLRSDNMNEVRSAYSWFTYTGKKCNDTFITYKEVLNVLDLNRACLEEIAVQVENTRIKLEEINDRIKRRI